MLCSPLTEQGRKVVRAADANRPAGLGANGTQSGRNLLRKGWLSRLIGGRYMFLPPEHGPENLGENNVLALAAAVVDPSYVGWWAAASFHGLTTQKPDVNRGCHVAPGTRADNGGARKSDL